MVGSASETFSQCRCRCATPCHSWTCCYVQSAAPVVRVMLGQELRFLCRFGARQTVHACASFDPNQQFCVVIYEVSAILLRHLVCVPSSCEFAPRGRCRPWHITIVPFLLDHQFRQKENHARRETFMARAHPLKNGCSPTPLRHTQPPASSYESSRPFYTLAEGRKISVPR